MKFHISSPVHLDGEIGVRSVVACRVSISGAGGFDYRLLPPTDGWVHGSRLKTAKGYGGNADDGENPFPEAA